MSDNTDDDDMDGLSDPFSYEDLISQRAMAFYHVARLTDMVQDEAVKDLCLTMLRKLNASIKAPSTAELRSMKAAARLVDEPPQYVALAPQVRQLSRATSVLNTVLPQPGPPLVECSPWAFPP